MKIHNTAAVFVGLSISFAPIAGAQDFGSLSSGNGYSENNNVLIGNEEQLDSMLQNAQLTVEEKTSFQAIDQYKNLGDKSFDYGKAKHDPNIAPTVVKDFAIGLLARGWRIDGAGTDLSSIEDEAQKIADQSASSHGTCSGAEGYNTTPPSVFLTSCQAADLDAAVSGGAKVGTIAALITADTSVQTVVAGTVAGEIMAHSGVKALCTSLENGVQITAAGVCTTQ